MHGRAAGRSVGLPTNPGLLHPSCRETKSGRPSRESERESEREREDRAIRSMRDDDDYCSESRSSPARPLESISDRLFFLSKRFLFFLFFVS
mmetsp:Transcript_51502/g.154619  ORF Transcript_51502/g.154619 Transcript_51502/m.154619 type:complete len:92 (-) Transcript_51502:845-1120(-)